MIIKLDESALLAGGFSRAHVELMRHLVTQVGKITGETTLPEVAARTDTLSPIVDSLIITVAAAGVAVSDLQVDALEAPASDRDMARRLEDIESELAGHRLGRAALTRQLEEMQADAERMQADRRALVREIEDLQTENTSHTLSIADLRRRISTLEDA